MVAKKITDGLIREIALDSQLMKRVRIANMGQVGEALKRERGNRYMLSEPLAGALK